MPALDLFPSRVWARLASRRWRHAGHDLLGDIDPRGLPPLRATIADYLSSTRGVRCDAGRVMIVSGAQAALDLVARTILEQEDPVWVEDPGYVGARQLLRQCGAALVPIPVDAEGMMVPDETDSVPSPRLICVTPAHHSPLGVTMSLPRRQALLDCARRKSAWIFEDDYDGEYRYGLRPLSALQGLDFDDRVIHVGTFSKALLPSLRLGYMVLPERLIDPISSLFSLTARFVPGVDQAVLADFIAEGHFSRHIRRVRNAYELRHMMLRSECQRLLSNVLEIPAAAAGLDTVAWLPAHWSDTRVANALLAAGVETRPLSQYRVTKRGRPGLVLGAAPFDERAIRQGVARMASALRSDMRVERR